MAHLETFGNLETFGLPETYGYLEAFGLLGPSKNLWKWMISLKKV